jgi:hypothetical protein
MSERTEQQRDAEWEQRLQQDRAWLLQQPQFCRLANEFLHTTGVFRLSFAGEQTHATAFNEGQRNMGLRWLAEFERADPMALQHLRTHARPPRAARPTQESDE